MAVNVVTLGSIGTGIVQFTIPDSVVRADLLSVVSTWGSWTAAANRSIYLRVARDGVDYVRYKRAISATATFVSACAMRGGVPQSAVVDAATLQETTSWGFGVVTLVGGDIISIRAQLDGAADTPDMVASFRYEDSPVI